MTSPIQADKVLDRNAIEEMDARFRTRLINSLSGFKSANLVGTINKDGVTNLSMVSSAFHLGANPPLMGMIIRPHTVRRDTLENLLEKGFYTLNHVHPDLIIPAHQTSARYDQGVSEFDATGLTPEFGEIHPAPYVLESRLKIGLQFRKLINIEINDTNMIVGEVVEVRLPQEIIGDDGLLDIEAIESVAISGLDRYHSTQSLGRLSYAKPDSKPEFIA